jgi:hypothetical protein
MRVARHVTRVNGGGIVIANKREAKAALQPTVWIGSPESPVQADTNNSSDAGSRRVNNSSVDQTRMPTARKVLQRSA